LPTYEYLCADCSCKQEISVPISEHKESVTCSCGKEAWQVFETSTLFFDIKPFVTQHINGSPLLVKSRMHRTEILKRHNLVEAG